MNASILTVRRLVFLALLWVLVFLLVLTLNWLLDLVAQEEPWHPILRTALITAILVPMISLLLAPGLRRLLRGYKHLQIF